MKRKKNFEEVKMINIYYIYICVFVEYLKVKSNILRKCSDI